MTGTIAGSALAAAKTMAAQGVSAQTIAQCTGVMSQRRLRALLAADAPTRVGKLRAWLDVVDVEGAVP